ncbi:MAG: DUF2934 domain-containing protein [Planctomycetota bacterium]|nr:DUF2934 domain-containing protein [Planctomycetota bacterium]
MARKSAGTSNAKAKQSTPSSNYQGTPRTTAITPQSVKSPARAIALPVLSHEQIAKRARAIWEKKGRPAGQDEQNWLQAESELGAELQA